LIELLTGTDKTFYFNKTINFYKAVGLDDTIDFDKAVASTSLLIMAKRLNGHNLLLTFREDLIILVIGRC
jgi:hypothetical protein